MLKLKHIQKSIRNTSRLLGYNASLLAGHKAESVVDESLEETPKIKQRRRNLEEDDLPTRAKPRLIEDEQPSVPRTRQVRIIEEDRDDDDDVMIVTNTPITPEPLQQQQQQQQREAAPVRLLVCVFFDFVLIIAFFVETFQ